MLGDRVPVSLKIFLTALAIADDLGAILVIALFYGGQVQISCLLAALVIMLAVYFMKEMGEKRMFFYLVPAVVIWGLFYYSGVAFGHFGRGDGHADPDDAPLQQGVFRP